VAKLYTILSIIGWSFTPVFFGFVAWRIHRMKARGTRGFQVVQDNEKLS